MCPFLVDRSYDLASSYKATTATCVDVATPGIHPLLALIISTSRPAVSVALALPVQSQESNSEAEKKQ
jgi:hypothetical protein